MHTALENLIKGMGPFLDHLYLPIAIIDTNGVYVYYNQESADMDGCSIEYALGKPIVEMYPNLNPENSTMIRALRGESFVNHQQNYYNSKGKLITYAHTTMPIYAPGTKTSIGAIEVGWDLAKER